jgi:hypothetical protein
LNLPVAEGQSALDIPRWNGEESEITPATPEEYAIGPVTLGGLAFDDQGNASIQGVPASTLEQALGIPPIQLPPNVLALVQTLGVETFVVNVQPNGIDLTLNDQPLPGVAYDADTLARLQTYLPAFVQDPATLETLNQVIPLLPATQATVAVSFTGEQAAPTELPVVDLAIDGDGRLAVLNLPVGAQPVVPAEVLQNLQSANVQQLDVSLQPEGLFLAANGQPLPSVTWTEESLGTVAGLVGPMAGMDAEGITSLMGIATGLGPQLRISVPPAAGSEPISPTENVTFTVQPVEADPQAATLRINLTVDDQGNIVGLGGFSAEELAALGISLPALPADTVATLRSTGAQEVVLDTQPGMLTLRLDGADALNIAYDTASLNAALQVAMPFLGDSPLANPAVNQLVTQVLLPQLPTADVDVVVTFQ